MDEIIQDEFEGVFYFTNPTDEEFVALWNNKEYHFPPQSTVPLIIRNEPLENIQEIRKRFAYALAEKRWYQGEEYEKMKKMGNGLPPVRDDKVLEPMIQECLKPLVRARAVVTEGKTDTTRFKATKAMGKDDNPNAIFAEENKNPPVLGVMSES